MGTIQKNKLRYVKKLYYEQRLPMREVADKLGVPINAVVYFMRHNNIKRRSLQEASRVQFENKKLSFTVRKKRDKQLEIAGAMLYWAEGHKTEKAMGIDFANSDPEMMRLFMLFLRNRYDLDESRLRGHIYCYSNQNVKDIIHFWSDLMNIPEAQFIKPYVRSDFKPDGRKMKHGLAHVRYSDKKLLLDVLNLIESYKQEYRVGSPVGGGNGL